MSETRIFAPAKHRADEQQAMRRIRKVTAVKMANDNVTFYTLVPASLEERLASQFESKRASAREILGY